MSQQGSHVLVAFYISCRWQSAQPSSASWWSSRCCSSLLPSPCGRSTATCLLSSLVRHLSQLCMSSSSAHLFSLHVVAVQHGGALTYASCHRVQWTLPPATLIIWLSKLLWCVVLQAPFMGCRTRATTGRRSLGLLRAPSLEASSTASA